jgi:hypothetical protein
VPEMGYALLRVSSGPLAKTAAVKTPMSTSGSTQSAQTSLFTGGQKRTVPSSIKLISVSSS